MPHPLIPDLQELAAPVAAGLGLELREVRLHTHRLPLTLQVVVQRADATDISLEECASLSGPLGDAIEASGLLTEAYVLEITSPGIGEDLRDDRDFRSFRGFPVAVTYQDARGERTTREGLLLERDAEEVRLNQRGRIVRIPRSAVLSVRLIQPEASD
ncbi:MAG: ribosome assembly cofactor RimP [Prochlorococcaceae cyanobacterium]